MNFTILRFDSLDSTNTEALKHARNGAEEGLCIIAGQQTAGKGRHGRVWASPAGAGLYISIVLRPKIEPRFLPLLTLAAGIAVHDALTELGLNPDIKWPNDVLVNERKICGILAEMTESKSGVAVVIGIGINLSSKDLPPEIAATSTSVATELKRNINSSDLEPSLLKYFEYFYGVASAVGRPATILGEWKLRSTYASGKSVRVMLENGAINGVTDGIEPNGGLRIRSSDGSVTIVQTGDVQHLRQGTD